MKKLYVFTGLFLLLTSFASSWGAETFTTPAGRFTVTGQTISDQKISWITRDVFARIVLREVNGGTTRYLKNSHQSNEVSEIHEALLPKIDAVEKATLIAFAANVLEGVTNFCGLNEKLLASLFDKKKNVNLFRYHPNQVEVAQFFLGALIQPIVSSAAIYHLRGRSDGNDFLKNQQVKEAFCQIATQACFWGLCSELRKIKILSSVTSWFIPGSVLPSKDGRLKTFVQYSILSGLSRVFA